jgi:hypothetical protein
MCHIICISLTSDLINFKALFIYSVFSFIVFFFYYIFLLLCFLTHHYPRRSYFITFLLCIFFYSFFYASSIFITHLSLKTSAFIITKLTGPVMKPGIPYTSSPTNIMTSMAKGDIPSLSPIHFDSIISRTK